MWQGIVIHFYFSLKFYISESGWNNMWQTFSTKCIYRDSHPLLVPVLQKKKCSKSSKKISKERSREISWSVLILYLCICVFVKHKYSWSCSPFNSGWKMTGISTTFSASLRDLVQKSQMKRKRKWRKVQNKNIKHMFFLACIMFESTFQTDFSYRRKLLSCAENFSASRLQLPQSTSSPSSSTSTSPS